MPTWHNPEAIRQMRMLRGRLVYTPANVYAGVVKLVYTQGLGPCAARCVGSSPTSGIDTGRRQTIRKYHIVGYQIYISF